jgi:multicomponent Na+:H+ antiporter subunit E
MAALAQWAFASWLLLTWTVDGEQLISGAILAVCVAVAVAPLGTAVGPWRLLRQLPGVLRLAAACLVRIVRANVSLAIRIWRPSRPLASGMVVVPTRTRTGAEQAATGLLTSLIVDNQIVDLGKGEFQYHAVSVPEDDPAEHINAPTERLVLALTRGGRR